MRRILLSGVVLSLALACGRAGREASAGLDAAPAGPAPSASSAASASRSIDALITAIPLVADRPFTDAYAAELTALSLACVDREFPNKPELVLDGADALRLPRQGTPAFFGCYDWHSAVHGHWAMARALRLFPTSASAPALRRALDQHLRPELLARELAFFELPRNKLFERPYGWGWLLRLAAELRDHPSAEARAWGEALTPLAQHLAVRLVDYLSRLSVPIRAGTHANTAFTLVHALDYARAVGDEALAKAIERRARELYLGDRACPIAYEPSGEDFISPCLAEIDLLRRVLGRDELLRFLDGFLPDPGSEGFAPWLRPIAPKDPKDPRIGHLVGLGMHRAWAMRGLARALPEGDPRRPFFERLARLHGDAALTQMAGTGYGGEHWLASFAVYLLSDAGSGTDAVGLHARE